MAAVLRFVITMVGVAFATATLLAIYESTKPGGYNKGCERQIVVFSLIFGFVAALIAFGLIGGRSAAGFFDGP